MPGGEAAWGALRRTEACLTKGVDVFEGEMAGVGMMEADARDALGGRWGAGGGRVAGRGGGDQGGGRVRGEEGGHRRDGGGRTGCAWRPGGRLVEAAAQGAEEGEIRPLMAMLLGEHEGVRAGGGSCKL